METPNKDNRLDQHPMLVHSLTRFRDIDRVSPVGFGNLKFHFHNLIYRA